MTITKKFDTDLLFDTIRKRWGDDAEAYARKYTIESDTNDIGLKWKERKFATFFHIKWNDKANE